ncbi:extracellular solute-binding protein [Kaistia dalseonensis]|uniref:Multiple sugar transport system substrate-binding protein n=1 Tax=Kaistia dalseonensis TaxID=410840 RepID=A0ABU0HAR8_9HYPH|nr:extracellular solute-binding protein [Kaistia dalseonensis]MCX5495963.1 extracellular solute-binding protein [Kaistia dalseonensis]MDQ0438566.1 multiple sugar transport system substrate-binding protein [Kaistia dalseonensis]
MPTHPITLKGMTWSHPRGYDPVVGCAAIYQEKTGIAIEWEQRSLQDFESFPVEDLARNFDLIVIDHPHVGQVTKEGCLTPLDVPGRDDERLALEAGSVGRSYESYHWQGRQWAFPIDSATPVLAFRPDLVASPPSSWDEVFALAEAGHVLAPLRSPHALMMFFTLSAHLGTPCSVVGPELIAIDAGARVYELMHRLARSMPSVAFELDPIGVFERMAEAGSTVAVAPLLYGYVNYAIDGFRPHRLGFADMPVVDDLPPHGSALGGTGIAVSAYSTQKDAAIDFAYWLASADVQRGPYIAHGGQAGHAAAWADDAANRLTHDFYRATRATLEGAWVRPRHNGYMHFQEEASQRISLGLKAGEHGETVIADLNALFRRSFSHA